MGLGTEFVLSADQMKRSNLIARFNSGKLSRARVALLLQISERSVSRLASRVEYFGIEGVLHRNRGRVPHNKICDEVKEKVMALVRKRYFDMNLTHIREMLMEAHQLDVPYGPLRRWCLERDLVKRKRRKKSRRRDYRTRMPSEGYMLQMDGSHHQFVKGPEWVLITCIDDASNEIAYGEFFDGETTLGCMKVFREIIKRKGIPLSVYTDKAGWSGGQKRVQFCQFKRACEELGVEVIFADSPQAKGRIERAFGTIQDRFPPMLRLMGIKTKARATEMFNEGFLPRYWNKKLKIGTKCPDSQYKAIPQGMDLDQIFCIKEIRCVGRDHVFQYKGQDYYIRTKAGRFASFEEVEIRTYPDAKKWKVFFQEAELDVVPVNRQRTTRVKPMSFQKYADEMDLDLGIKKPKNLCLKRRRDKIAEKITRQNR